MFRTGTPTTFSINANYFHSIFALASLHCTMCKANVKCAKNLFEILLPFFNLSPTVFLGNTLTSSAYTTALGWLGHCQTTFYISFLWMLFFLLWFLPVLCRGWKIIFRPGLHPVTVAGIYYWYLKCAACPIFLQPALLAQILKGSGEIWSWGDWLFIANSFICPGGLLGKRRIRHGCDHQVLLLFRSPVIHTSFFFHL